jgi:hypothetical protein
MNRRTTVAMLLVWCAASPLRAELKFTTHLELKKVEAPAGQPPNQMLVMMGDALGQQLLPSGPADLVFIVGEKGTRTEYTKAALGQSEGAISLAMPDGTFAVLNPKDQTYWRSTIDAAVGAAQTAGIKPEATAKRTGEFSTIAGVKCERVLVDLKIDLPIPEAMRSSLPPGFPTSLTMDGESCVATDQYQKYAEMAAKSKVGDFMAAMGLDKLMPGGIVLRQVLRLSTVQMESVVTSIGEEEVSPTLFTIPADYKEVPSPLTIK